MKIEKGFRSYQISHIQTNDTVRDMYVKDSLRLVIFISIILTVHGQLSLEELFSFNSKYTSTENSTDFRYEFSDFRLNYNKYNQLILNWNSSSLIFRNIDQPSSTICPNDEHNLENFRINFHDRSLGFIQTNQLYFRGIELCSLDDFIEKIYSEYSFYRSRWALLINLETNNPPEQHHLAIATNGEMTFVLFIIPSKYSSTLEGNSIDLSFANENNFRFSRSLINIWRIERGFVQIPQSISNVNDYQLSKSKFTLFNNESFVFYGTQFLNPRRFSVYIDGTSVNCIYDHILQCKFPILPWDIHDSHQPVLKVSYNLREILLANLTLNSRIRLDQLPTNHSLTNITTFQVNIDPNLCANNSLTSLFTLVVHVETEDINGKKGYKNIVKKDLPIDCNTTAKLGQEIDNLIQPISIDDIESLNVDLTHRWSDHEHCPSETTRIYFN